MQADHVKESAPSSRSPGLFGSSISDDPDERLKIAERMVENYRRDLYFCHLLGGGFYSDEQDLIYEGERAGITFSYPDFILVGTRIETWGPLFEAGEHSLSRYDLYFILRNVLQDCFPGDTKVYASEYRGQTVALVNLAADSGQGPRRIVWSAQQAVEFLENNFDLSITAAISRVYSTPLKLYQAYEDTEKIFEYQQVMLDDKQVIAYEDLGYQNLRQSSTRFLSMETKLLTCIQAADFDGLRQTVEELISKEFIDTKPTIDIFRYRVYGVVNSLLFMTDALKETLGEAFYDKLDPGHRLVEAETLSDIMLTADNLFSEMQAHFKTMKKDDPPAWVDEAKRFIDENYMDVNLSVNYVADAFDVSPAYCSRVFRQFHGERLFDYLQKKRLAAAKSLLSGTDTIKAIAEKCGFPSALTMSRAFKRYEGTSPSKLRG